MTNSFSFIKYEKEGSLVTITINRPDTENALHGKAGEELGEAWRAYQADDNACCAILTGEGDEWFCAGREAKWIVASYMSGGAPKKNEAKQGDGGNNHNFSCYKPMIAAVNGHASHMGFDMALACDIVIAGEHARFSLSAPRVAGAVERHGLTRIAREMPLKIGMGVLMTGGELTAREVEKWGLVNEVVPKGEVMAAARRWANRILECAPAALQCTKETVVRSLDLRAREALRYKPIGCSGIKSKAALESMLAHDKGET